MDVEKTGGEDKPVKKTRARATTTSRSRRGRKPTVAEAAAAKKEGTEAPVIAAAKQLDVADIVQGVPAEKPPTKGRGPRRPPRAPRGRKPPADVSKVEEAPAPPVAPEPVRAPVPTVFEEVQDLWETDVAPAEPTEQKEPAPSETRESQPDRSQRGRRSRRRGSGRGRRDGAPATEIKAQPRTEEIYGEEVDVGDEAPSTPSRTGRPQGRHKPASDSEYIIGQGEEDDDEAPVSTGDGTTRSMLINVSGGDECRVAVLGNGRLEELFIERASTQSHVGNIYKGRVTNVEPGIQAVFVDFGLKKDGFLHISDVQPQYFPDHRGAGEEVGRKIARHLRPPIQRCFRRGQEVIVQVTKEGVGTKGPTLTTYLSIPGRFLVMMPGMNGYGVSRKIEDDVARRSMRDVMKELKLPNGMGFILRTAGLDRNKRDLQRDLNYLLRLWKTVAERVRRIPSPAELYRESDLVTRAIRDVYTLDFERIVVDDAETARQAQEFIQVAMPRSKTVVEFYSAREPLFHRYGIEDEIEKINLRQVPLPSGGSLVIESTEALVAIDVNSGRFRSVADTEELAYRTNMEAALEIARQLRLRDLGGLIICDFIDMRQERHMRAVERKLRDELKKHKERARILRMSAFGIIEMTRQRQGPSLKRNLYDDCPHCKGTGLVKMSESIMLDAMRMIQLAAHHADVQKTTIKVAQDVAVQILNSKRALLHRIETETGKTVIIRGDASFTGDHMECTCEDASGRPVNLVQPNQNLPKPGPRKVAL